MWQLPARGCAVENTPIASMLAHDGEPMNRPAVLTLIAVVLALLWRVCACQLRCRRCWSINAGVGGASDSLRPPGGVCAPRRLRRVAPRALGSWRLIGAARDLHCRHVASLKRLSSASSPICAPCWSRGLPCSSRSSIAAYVSRQGATHQELFVGERVNRIKGRRCEMSLPGTPGNTVFRTHG